MSGINTSATNRHISDMTDMGKTCKYKYICIFLYSVFILSSSARVMDSQAKDNSDPTKTWDIFDVSCFCCFSVYCHIEFEFSLFEMGSCKTISMCFWLYCCCTTGTNWRNTGGIILFLWRLTSILEIITHLHSEAFFTNIWMLIWRHFNAESCYLKCSSLVYWVSYCYKYYKFTLCLGSPKRTIGSLIWNLLMRTTYRKKCGSSCLKSQSQI